MGIVTTQHSMSVDGFIAGQPGSGGDRLHSWASSGDLRSEVNPAFTMDPVNVKFFDQGVSRCGAVIAGRPTYDVRRVRWRRPDGSAALVRGHPQPTRASPGLRSSLHVCDHRRRDSGQSRPQAADNQDVLTWASMVHQCLRAGLLDELIVSIVPVLLGEDIRLLESSELDGAHLSIVNVANGPGGEHPTYRIDSPRPASVGSDGRLGQ